MRGQRLGTLLPLLLLALGSALSPAAARDLTDVEKEFKAAIEKMATATVVCVPTGVEGPTAGSSSGVIVSRDGYLLSDGDVGTVLKVEGRRVTGRDLVDDVDVRVPNLESGGFATYAARVVKRARGSDTTLLKVIDPPPGGFPDHLRPSASAHLKVGDFAFVMGNAFGHAKEAPPTLTAGVISALEVLPEGEAGGPWEFLYTSAAVNPGVNGGPCVDVEGRLIGTVSTWLGPEPGQPYQFLGKIVPIERVRAALAGVPEADELFGHPVDTLRRAHGASQLAIVFHYRARSARNCVVSLEAKRTQPLNAIVPQRGRQVAVPRYQGPFSGVRLPDGWIVTSLYNLTNTLQLLAPLARLPAAMEVETGLRAVESVTVHYPEGGTSTASIVAHDGLLGVALLKTDVPEARVGDVLPRPAPPDAFAVGRFALALGNPFGAKQHADPLLTVGLLSKQHVANAQQPWRGQWQTDASSTDGNCGGAVLDVEGRFLGVLQIWHPLGHGRNSGIGFLVPWSDLEGALERLKAGHSRTRGFLGIQFRDKAETPMISEVVPDSPAAAAGLVAGDRIVSVNGTATEVAPAVKQILASRWEGEQVELEIERSGKLREYSIVLGERP